MIANIVIKLNDGQSFVFGHVDTRNDLSFGTHLLFIGHEDAEFKLEEVKEILIKPMPRLQAVDSLTGSDLEQFTRTQAELKALEHTSY